MSVSRLERDYLPHSVQSAEIQGLQTPENSINRHSLVEFAGNVQTRSDLQKAGWDSEKEIKRFIGDINLGLINGLTLPQAVAFSTRILTDHIRFYDAEFIKQEPVLPHRNYFGFWQGEKRWLGNNGRPVVDSVDGHERMGAVKRAAKKTEEYLLGAENNSFIVSMSAEGPSGYLDENGCDAPHLNTYILVDYKDEQGNLRGATLVTDLTIDQAEKVMISLGAPANIIFAKRGTQMQRVTDLLENPAMPFLPEAYHNPLEFVLDRALTVRGEGNIRLLQKNGSVEVRSVAEIRRKITNLENLLGLNVTQDRLIKELQDLILANYQQVEDPSFQQEIIDRSEETVLLFARYHQKHHQNSNKSVSHSVILPQYTDQYLRDDREIVRSSDRRNIREDFRQEIAFLQTRAGCPSAVKAAGGSGVGGTSGLGESDSMGPLHFPCPKCGAINKRPWGETVDFCQSCGSSEVSCKSSGAKVDKQKEDSKVISFPSSTSRELAKAA